jgi:hypothetical protein
MQLIARRAIGVSENRRKLYGVGFGIASFNGPYELKIEGSAVVLRRLSAPPVREADEDTPAIRRNAPRNVSVIFMMFSALPESCGDSHPRLSRLCGVGALARELSTTLEIAQTKSPAAAEPNQTSLIPSRNIAENPKQSRSRACQDNGHDQPWPPK